MYTYLRINRIQLRFTRWVKLHYIGFSIQLNASRNKVRDGIPSFLTSRTPIGLLKALPCKLMVLLFMNLFHGSGELVCTVPQYICLLHLECKASCDCVLSRKSRVMEEWVGTESVD